MADKQNLAEKIIRNWQKHFQDWAKDPRLIDIMAENYARLQETLNQATGEPGASSPVHDDDNAKLCGFGKRLKKIESKLAFLESYIKGHPKKRSK